MLLKDVSARFSMDGSGAPCLDLVKNGNVLETLPVVPATQDHRSFILATWVRGALPSAKLAGVQKAIYLVEEPRVAESKWQDCMVVVDPADQFVVLAWICVSTDGTLYNVYVTPDFRRMGILKSLIGGLVGPDVPVHHVRPLTFPAPKHWVYNPYRLSTRK